MFKEHTSLLCGSPPPPGILTSVAQLASCTLVNRHNFSDFFLALNSTAGATMALGIILSALLFQYNRSIWYLDSAVALFIAIALFGYGIR